MQGLFPILIISAAVLFTIYITGYLLSYFLVGKNEIPPSISFFTKLALGYMAIPVAYSLFFTKGYTILSGVLILFLIATFLNRKNWGFSKFLFKKEIKYFSLGILIVWGLVIFQCWRYGFFDEIYFHAYRQDNGIYVTVAEYLKITGIETPSPWYQLIDVSADGVAKIYHFEDFWFFAHILGFLPDRPLDLFNYVLAPVLGGVQFFASLALLEALRKNGHTGFLEITFALGSVLLIMWMPMDFTEWSKVLHINVLTYPKVAVLPILVPFVLVADKYNIKYLGGLAFGFIIISDPLFLPTVFGASVIYLGWMYYAKKEIKELVNLAFVFFAIIYFFAFYSVFGSLENSSKFDPTLTEHSYFIGFFKNITFSSVRHLIFFLPAYLTIFFLLCFYRKNLTLFEKGALGLLLFILGFSSVTWGIMNKNFGSFQFDTSTQTTFGALLLVTCFFILKEITIKENYKNAVKKILLILMLGQFIYGTIFSNILMANKMELGVEKSFVQKAEAVLQDKNKIGAAITNTDKFAPEGYDLTAYIEADPRICFFCNFLKHIGEGYWANQIDVPLSLNDLRNKGSATAVELSPFYRFVQKLKKEKKFTTLENAQMEFIKKYKIDFVVVEQGASIPEFILQKSEIILEDGFSNTKLVLLKMDW